MNSSTLRVPKLSVVIVSYNTRDDLRACLESLRAVTLPLEIIVVDNASRDGSVDMARAEFPDVKLLAQPVNTWFCGGNNIGIAAAAGEYILLLNPDTVAQPGALEAMAAFLDAHPDYTGVTVQLRYPDGAIQRTCSRVPTFTDLLLETTPLGWLLPGWRRRAAARRWYADWARDSDRDVEVLPGSCLMGRRGLALDDALRLYFPEDDLARRGYRRSRFLAGVHIVHQEKRVTRTWLATQTYFRDMLVYTRRHHGGAAAALLALLTRPLLGAMALKRQLNRQQDGG